MVRNGVVFLATLLMLTGSACTAAVTVSGTVVDGDGQPVPDAQVWVLVHEYDRAAMRMMPSVVASGRTDAEGRFGFAGIEWAGGRSNWRAPMAVAYKEGLALGWRGAEQPGKPLDIALEQAEPIPGSILDLEGNPIPGVRVKVSSMSRMEPTPTGKRMRDWFHVPPEMEALVSCAPADDGSLSFDLAPPETHMTAEIEVPGYRPLSASSQTEVPLEVRLGKAASLGGRLACPEPAEAAGIAMYLSGRFPPEASPGAMRGYYLRETTASDDEGRFQVEGLPPGKYEVSTRPEASQKWQITGTQTIELAPGARVEDFEMELARAWPVKGRVMDADTGEPIAGTTVWARVEDARHQISAETDESGAYLIYVLAGRAWVSVGTPEGYFRDSEGYGRGQSIMVTAAEEITLKDLELRRALRVRGVVVDDEGELVAGARVWDADARPWQRDQQVTTDAQGQFELTGLDPDKTVVIHAATESTITSNPARVAPGDADAPLRLVVSERAASRVRGRIVDDRGQTVTHAQIGLMIHQQREHEGHRYTDSSRVGELKTDNEGRFESQVLAPDGEYSVSISATGHSPVETERWLAVRGEVHELGDIVLSGAWGSLAGVVVDTAGRPLAKALVSNAGDGPQRVSTPTDDQGHFELAGLFEGYAYAFAQAKGYRFGGVRAEAGADDLRIVLWPADGPRPEARAHAPVLDREREKELVEEIALEGIELTRGTDAYTRDSLIASLARVNPILATEIWHQEGAERENTVLGGLADGLLESDPDAAIDRLWNAEQPYTRTYQLNEFGRKLMSRNAELAGEAFSLAASAARAMGTEGWGVLSLAKAGRGLLELGRPEGREVVNEAFALAQELGVEEWEDCHTRGEVAKAMCLVDLDAALSLLEGFPTEGMASSYDDSAMTDIVILLASRDPEKAEEVLEKMTRRINRFGGNAQVAYEMAAKDRERALEFARGVKEGRERAYAVGVLALRFADDDEARAFDLIDEAMKALRDEAHAVSNRWPATVAGQIAHVAAQIGYPDTAGLVMQAMWLRPAPSTPFGPGYGRRDETEEIALSIAWVGTEAARNLLEPQVARIASDFEDVRKRLNAIVVAAAVVDPEWAVAIVRSLPDDDPGDERPPKARAYRALAETLSLAPDERLYEALHFWVSGKGVR